MELPENRFCNSVCRSVQQNLIFLPVPPGQVEYGSKAMRETVVFCDEVRPRGLRHVIVAKRTARGKDERKRAEGEIGRRGERASFEETTPISQYQRESAADDSGLASFARDCQKLLRRKKRIISTTGHVYIYSV